MKALCIKFCIISSLALTAFADAQQKEIQKELAKLQQLKNYIDTKIAQDQKLLKQIREEKAFLQQLKKSLEEERKKINTERYKKLAKDFENMDPEYAGEKLSKMENPTIAAYILYNMNPRKAGEALNYVDPKVLSKISQILIKLKKHEKK